MVCTSSLLCPLLYFLCSILLIHRIWHHIKTVVSCNFEFVLKYKVTGPGSRLQFWIIASLLDAPNSQAVICIIITRTTIKLMVSICLSIKRPITSCLIWTSVISCYECKAVALSPKFSFIIHMELHEREIGLSFTWKMWVVYSIGHTQNMTGLALHSKKCSEIFYWSFQAVFQMKWIILVALCKPQCRSLHIWPLPEHNNLK